MSQTSLLRFLWADGEIRHAAEPEKTLVGWSMHRLASGDCCLVGRTATSSRIRRSSFVVSFDAVTAVAITERGRRNLLVGELGDNSEGGMFVRALEAVE